MPGAGDLFTRHPALAQRTATVRAGVVDGVETTIQVKEGDLPPRRLDTPGLAWSEVRRARDPDELSHVSLLELIKPSSDRWHRSPPKHVSFFESLIGFRNCRAVAEPATKDRRMPIASEAVSLCADASASSRSFGAPCCPRTGASDAGDARRMML